MTQPLAYFVQFPHPGEEHRPRGDRMPWNVGDHKRKFLMTPGRYVDAVGEVAEAELVYWAEWEPPSEVVATWGPSSDLPCWLQRPYWVRPTTSTARQNTDPWVFGPCMLYSNCRQLASGNPNWLQRLPRGSVVCFSSTKHGEFCLDTVFVVASSAPWDLADDVPEVDDAFAVCTVESVRASLAAIDCGGCRPRPCCGPGRRFTLYRGATYDDRSRACTASSRPGAPTATNPASPARPFISPTGSTPPAAASSICWDDGEDVPVAGEAVERTATSWLELDRGADDEVSDGL
jgi:hypothetical protein